MNYNYDPMTQSQRNPRFPNSSHAMENVLSIKKNNKLINHVLASNKNADLHRFINSINNKCKKSSI